MSYGFYLINDAGITQIDQDYSNFLIIETGILYGNPFYTGTNIPNSWLTDVVGLFVRPLVYGVAFCMAGDGYGGTGVHMWAASAIAFKYYRIAKANVLSSENDFGLEIYKQDTSLSFSSFYNTAKVLTALATPSRPPGTYSMTLPNTPEDKYVDLTRTAQSRINIFGSPVEIPICKFSLISETQLDVIVSTTLPASTYLIGGL